MRIKRLGKRDWLDIGLSALRAGEADALTMESLCGRAGRTRGGFYSHFSGIEDFWLQAARLWRDELVDRSLPSNAASGRRLDLLNEVAARLDPALELGIRRLAFRLPPVAELVAQADDRRVAMLQRLYSQTGMSDADASALARIEYAALIGLQFTEPQTGPAELRGLYGGFLRLTGRA